jgi:hypothetical protein
MNPSSNLPFSDRRLLSSDCHMAPSELRALADGGRNAVEAGPSRAPVSRDFVDWIARLE